MYIGIYINIYIYRHYKQPDRRLGKNTSAVRKTSVSRPNGGPIKGHLEALNTIMM